MKIKQIIDPQPDWVICGKGMPEYYEDNEIPGFIWHVPYPVGEDGSDVDWQSQFVPSPYGKVGSLLIDDKTNLFYRITKHEILYENYKFYWYVECKITN